MPGKQSFKAISIKQLRRLFRVSVEAQEKQVTDIAAFAAEQQYQYTSRRKFLGDAARATALVAVAGFMSHVRLTGMKNTTGDSDHRGRHYRTACCIHIKTGGHHSKRL